MNDRMSREQFFEFTQEYQETHPALEYYRMLQEFLQNAIENQDKEMIAMAEETINQYFGAHTWVTNSET